MSADDFQSKYASVMESMLKRAIAETTKLFENMVDELKAEISVIKKENEDLKTKCIQYESAKNKPEAQPVEVPPIAEPPDASEKCDTAIQCDLVPCRTILVEECEPISHKELERQDLQHSYGLNNYSLQEHNYVSYRDRTSPMEYVVLKKESELKQEDDCEVACGQVLGTFGASAGEAEIGGPHISDSSIEHIKVLKKSTQLVLQLPRSEAENAQLAQNQSTDIKRSLAISPEDSLRDVIKEESEMVEVAERVLSGNKRRVPSTCHIDSATTQNEKTALKSAPVSTQKAGEELNNTVPEGKAISKPNSLLGRKRGRPPKKSRQKQALPPSADEGTKHQADSKAPPPGKELTESSLALVTETSSGINPSIQKGVNTVLEGNNVEFQSLSSSLSSVEQPTLELQDCCPEVEMDATADKTPDVSSCVPPEASKGLLKACQTSVSLQDALLLVEAMNQSTMESDAPSLKVPSQPQIESSSASSLVSLKSIPEIPTVQHTAPVETQTVSAEMSSISADSKATSSSKDTNLKQVVVMLQQVPPVNCAAPPAPLSSTCATQTVIQSLPLPHISKSAPNKRPRTIIILPRSSPACDNAKTSSQTQRSSVNSATLNKSNLPHSSAGAETALPPDAPVPSPVPSKTIKIVYKKPDPVLPIESSTILTDHQYVAPKTITIVSKQIPSVVPRKTEPVVLAVKKDNNEPVASVPPESSTQLISELQESSSSFSGDSTLPEKTNDADDDLNSPGQIIPDAESMIAPSQEHSGSEFPADRIQPPVALSLCQTTEPTLHAVVRLTRLPFSISTKESVLISTLISKGVIQEESLFAHAQEESPVDFCLDSPGPSTVDELTPDLKEDILSSDMEYKEEDVTRTHNDTSDPHDQISKTLFPAKPSGSPLENEPTINERSNAKGAKSIVSRLRSHLQAHLKAKRGSIKQIAANDSTPIRSQLSPLSPKRLTKLDFNPEKTKSIADEKGSDLEMSGIPSLSTSPKSKPKTKQMKRKSSSFSHRSCSLTDGSIRETTRSEHELPSPKRVKMAKNHTSPQTDEEYTPQKPRQVKGHRGRKSNHKVANNKKLTSAAKCSSRVGKKRGTYKKRKLVLPVIESGVKKKWHAKVWYPPTLPPNEKPITDIIRPPPLKVEYRIPDIPLSAPAIVSPLQPLAVIGRHLLRNQCGECGRVFSNSNALESHVSLHKIYRPFSCKLCGKYFPDAKTFKRHDRVHRNGRIHVCQQCGRGFVYRFSLGKHIQMVHSRIRPFICQVCGNGFYTKRDVEIHIRIHTGEKPFQCHICERRFTRKVELNVHLRWHNGEKRHWCQYCGKGFLDYNNLKRHRYTHTGEKPCSCPHCPKSFTQTGHLKKHITSMHKDVIGID
uniref:Uncharacterized LOC105931495 n=1 Tax=Fundulus heteroclitus TaxID=8078 RepID=A0A3Q2QP06_FUNHE